MLILKGIVTVRQKKTHHKKLTSRGPKCERIFEKMWHSSEFGSLKNYRLLFIDVYLKNVYIKKEMQRKTTTITEINIWLKIINYYCLCGIIIFHHQHVLRLLKLWESIQFCFPSKFVSSSNLWIYHIYNIFTQKISILFKLLPIVWRNKNIVAYSGAC